MAAVAAAAKSIFPAKLEAAPFCVEISLRTSEEQTMALETWSISLNTAAQHNHNTTTTTTASSAYEKMSLVLRSLMCITRSTPTYQLSRRQSSDTYVLLYKMYCGEPVVHHLGENYATSKVGTVSTPIGSIVLNLAYRTQLTTMTVASAAAAAAVVASVAVAEPVVASRDRSHTSTAPVDVPQCIDIRIQNDHFHSAESSPVSKEAHGWPHRNDSSSAQFEMVARSEGDDDDEKTSVSWPDLIRQRNNSLMCHAHHNEQDTGDRPASVSASARSNSTLDYSKVKRPAFVLHSSVASLYSETLNYYTSSLSLQSASVDEDESKIDLLPLPALARTASASSSSSSPFTPSPHNNNSRRQKQLKSDDHDDDATRLPDCVEKSSPLTRASLSSFSMSNVQLSADDFVFIESVRIRLLN